MVKQNTTKTVCCSRRQKIWGVIALAGLFACGLFVGATWNGGGENNKLKKIGMTAEQCQSLSSQILSTAGMCGDWAVGQLKPTDTCVAKLRELNEIYNKNCAGRAIEVDEPKEEPAPVANEASNKPTCEVIEDMLLKGIEPETYADAESHERNITIYKRLITHGCAENTEKYQALIQREQDIINALTGGVGASDKTCAEIESLLLNQLNSYGIRDSDSRIERAKIYANLSERGCPENSQHYVELAAKELEIARALRDDNFNQNETVEVVETYKRLEMKQAAADVLDKVQKLTDPAIDFILQVQKIIEE